MVTSEDISEDIDTVLAILQDSGFNYKQIHALYLLAVMAMRLANLSNPRLIQVFVDRFQAYYNINKGSE
jgi:hypothetical protein